ncbi:GNAT family N-acetyltransferase [Pseudomonas syringae]|uniref:GNAT family N-acetyltransferase n=1 Tax=Pseudomonas syringae TaxID=317 RepID=UPI001F32C38E|nr:GNAT family N-acetyltransferase [Pseudomonas syringae]MCF5706543.1 GNAT family N-acetyltransferase [Pseudomonas syringae]
MRRDLGGFIPQAQRPIGVTVVPFAAHLAPAAHDLLTEAYRNAEGSVPEYPAWLTAFERNPEFDRSLCFLAMVNADAVGFISCWTSAFIKDLVVRDDYRQRGIGKALLNHLFAHLRQRGERTVDLNVMENNLIARCLYEKSDMSYVSRSPVIAS